jgi:hypothetical protein
MNFSQDDFFKMSQGIARLRHKNEVGVEEADDAIEYFSRISKHVNQEAVTIELANCQHCLKDVPADILYKFDSLPPFRGTHKICPDCLIYVGS